MAHLFLPFDAKHSCAVSRSVSKAREKSRSGFGSWFVVNSEIYLYPLTRITATRLAWGRKFKGNLANVLYDTIADFLD